MHRLHGCTCAGSCNCSLHSQECKYWNINEMCLLLFNCMLNHLTRKHLGRASVSVSVMICVSMFQIYQCSYLNILQAPLLSSCLHDKAKHALMQVQAFSLHACIYILYHSGVIILLVLNLKTLIGPITFCSG